MKNSTRSTKKSFAGFFIGLSFVILTVIAAGVIFVVYQRYSQHLTEKAEIMLIYDGKVAESAGERKQVDGLENSPQEIERIAREKFGLCRPGEIILRYEPLDQRKE